MATGLVGQKVYADAPRRREFEQVDDVAVVGDGHGFLFNHRFARHREYFGEVARNLFDPALDMARFDPRQVDLRDDADDSRDFRRLGLRAAHSAESRRDEEPPREDVAVWGPVEFHASGVQDGVVGAVDDALWSDIHPAARGHLSVVGDAELHRPMPVFLRVEHSDHERVGQDDARRFGARPEESERMPRLDDERLVAREDFEIPLDEPVLHPVLADLSRLSVGDEFIGVERDVEVEVVVDHDLESFAFDAFAPVLVDRTAPYPALRAESVAVDPPARAQFLEKFRREPFVMLLGDVPEGVLEREDRVRFVQRVSPVRSPADSRLEGLRFRQFVPFKGAREFLHVHLLHSSGFF
jgi:hypothetical protein